MDVKVIAKNIEFDGLVGPYMRDAGPMYPAFNVKFSILSQGNNVDLTFAVGEEGLGINDALPSARKLLAEFAEALRIEAESGDMGHAEPQS
ncbi:hypothetical protein [Ancylobacter sp. G4_0304]|uniref:hypothetical protein n=1 Tax=Ancylobacter sp. G4_0304 TaxID=3114289 RepID=UPI0039C74A96